jgi:hypothetical protein
MPRGRKLSTRTRKQISHLPKHAQRVYEKTHERALQHYRSLKKEKDEAKALKKQRIGLLGPPQREGHEEKEKSEEGKRASKE